MAELKTRYGTWLDLPRGLVFRFWWQHHVNAAGIWLTGHGHWRAAVLLWRLCRMW